MPLATRPASRIAFQVLPSSAHPRMNTSFSRLHFLSSGLLVAAALVSASSAPAAILSLDSVTRRSTVFLPPVDLTAEGTLDWTYWEVTGSAASASVAPTNSKSGATLISNAASFGGGGLRGSSTSATVGRYSYTDGTSPVSNTNQDLAGLLFNENLAANAVGKGFSLEITGSPDEERLVHLYLGGFDVDTQLTLSLNGVTSVVDTSQSFGNFGAKQIAVYTVRFQPDTIADTLSVTYIATARLNSSNSSHVGLEAVTVSAVPEPGAALSLVGGAGLLLGLRRRQRA